MAACIPKKSLTLAQPSLPTKLSCPKSKHTTLLQVDGLLMLLLATVSASFDLAFAHFPPKEVVPAYWQSAPPTSGNAMQVDINKRTARYHNKAC
jgi:hypothetical protein